MVLNITRSLVLALFLFGAYSRFHLYIGELQIPFVFCLLGGIVSLFAKKFKLKRSNLRYFIQFSFLNICLYVVSYFLVSYDVATVAKSLLQIEYSVFLALLFFDEICEWRKKELANFLKVFVWCVFALCLLDIFTPFHKLNIQILEVFGSQAITDLRYEQFPRPYPLTKEPSHVSKFLLIVMPSWFLLDGSKAYKKYFSAALILLVVIRSPVILGVIGLGLLYLYLDKYYNRNLFSSILTKLSLLASLGLIVFLVLQIMGDRITSILVGSDTSSLIRFARPYLILNESLNNYPLFGVGIGNTEKLAALYNVKYSFLDVQFTGDGYTIFSLFAPLAFWGILGTAMQFYLIARYLKGKRVLGNYTFLVFHYVLISISMGGFVTVDYWIYLFFIFMIYSEPKIKFN